MRTACRRIIGVASIAVTAVMLIVGAAGASPSLPDAGYHAKLTLSLAPNRIEHTSLVHIRYSATGLPVGASLVLQHEVGSAHVWRTVMNLKGYSGRANAPRVPQGLYVYRLLALVHRKGYAQSLWQRLYSYGPVTLGTICNTASNDISTNNGMSACVNGTAQVGNSVYAYAALLNADQYPQWLDAFDSTANTTCRSARFTFAEDSTHYGPYVSYLQLTQETMSASDASAPANTIGTLVSHLDGRPWHLDAATNPGGGFGYFRTLYMNATFDCWSATGY